MGDAPLSLKPAKLRFDKKIITNQMGKDIQVKLVKRIKADYSNSGIMSCIAQTGKKAVQSI